MHGHNGRGIIPIIILGGGIIGGLFFFFWWRISEMYGLRWHWQTTLVASIISFACVLFAFFLRNGGIPFSEQIGSVIIGITYCIWVLCFLLLIHLIVSRFVSIPAWLSTIILVGYLGVGLYFGTQTKITETTISSSKIEKNLNILFLSDLHVNALRHTSYIQSIINRIQEIKPDIVLIGGDLLDMPNKDFIDAFLPFNQLKMPIYATLGNHDAMGDKNVVDQIFSTTSIIPLRNQSVLWSGIQIVGIDDKSYWSGKSLDTIIQKSQTGLPSGKFVSGYYTIFISHQPQRLEKLVNYPIDLEVAGHTHAGQFIPFSWMIRLFNDYRYSLYQLGDRVAFVSQGVGSRGAPVRIGTRSEMVLIHLKKK